MAQFFGGAGVQAATLYRDGREELNFETGYHDITAALLAPGVMAEPPNDAFDTLRLGRYRIAAFALIGTTAGCIPAFANAV